jgi:8-oxo-dGTP pyrophosphatase MutT (NUDIX family)
MNRPPAWELVKTEHLQDCAVFQVRRALARSPRSGQVHPFYRIDADDWVKVVPLTPEGEVVMVRQWRHGSRAVTLEIPGGIVDPGETATRAAERELLEETGYRAGSLEHIGVVNPNPALFGNRVDTFLARDARRVAEVANEGHEETTVELVPAGEIPARLRAGEIDHALVIAALHWYSLAAAAAVPGAGRQS